VAHFKKEASIVRAPVANQIIDQFLHIVKWGELDYLIIDFPPGTGDIQLTLMQKAKISAALVVTTPQTVATLDVRKAIQLFQKMQIPLLGVVENMSYFLDPATGSRFAPFGSGGGESLAKEFELPLLAQIPIDAEVSKAGDEGKSLFDQAHHSEVARVFEDLGEKVDQLAHLLHEEELEVRQLDATHLEIFTKGQWHPLSLSHIQQHCPCAACEKGKKKVEKLSLLEFSSIGRYAIRITFSSGCSQGIYPMSLLRELAKS
jgi:ATP-binding protein involved in chromosome partitioning